MAETVKITKLDKGFTGQVGTETPRYLQTVAQVAAFVMSVWPHQATLDDLEDPPERVVVLGDPPEEEPGEE